MQTTTFTSYWVLQTALYANNLTTANNQRGLKVKNELESWTVEYDGLINQYQCNQYEWIGLKLKSPLFRPESFIADADSKTVMDIVTKKFLTVPNSETRLVVKVFIPKHLSSLGAMNAIASMLWLVDPLLNDIHPAHCGPNSLYSLGLQYTNLVNDDANDLQAELLSAVEVEDPWNNRLSPNRRPLELLPHPGELGEAKYSHGVHRILGANSVQDLIHLMDVAIYGEAEDHPYARPAYCFVDNKSTVALTQHCLDKSGTFFYESYPDLRYGSTIFDFLEEQGLGQFWESKLLSYGMVPVDDIDPRYQTWTIGTDVSLRRMPEWAGYKELNGLEIISRVLRDTPECWEEVLDMVSILRNNFRLTVGKPCGFHIHVSKGTGPIPLHLWSEMNVPADFEHYIPVDKIADRRTLGILKKLWTAETLRRLKQLIAPSSEDECKGAVEFRYLEGTLDPELILRWSQLMVSLFQFADLASPQAWQNFVPAVLQCPVLGKMDTNVLRVFLVFLGKGDDYGFWINRIEMIPNLPLDAQQLARTPADNNEILPPLDDGYVNALREELCSREMRLSCVIQRVAVPSESESSTDPDDRANILFEKASFFDD
ncbi:uncharacterized protein BKA55DRAFT_711578 [Fusarium redolens]|uniref:Uncharacterized protein n=1 Tax=Fusarium redolens TaxID=48865 RepID=A0A9P9R6H3_FUSRE|nr:uncharacterized protein BKA55DRAFT_711578 [Fusarium redolens]KAH7267115.1 hypothetical protein BKA55DRAFT_711578 [Fusarium redolens]